MTEWSLRPLSDLTENLDSRRVPIKEADRRPGPYPYYGASGIVDYVDDYLFEGLHLLIAEDGENLRTRKLPIAFLADGRFWVNNHAHIVRANGEADTRFLLYAMLVADVTSYLSGSTMPKLTQGNLNRIPILAPDKRNQQAIASVLGALDDKIELNRRMNETLEAMARAIFKDWFVDFGPTRAKMEGRAPYLAPDIWSLFPDRLDEEGKPEGWRYWPLQQIIDFKSGQNWLSQYRVESSQIPTFGANGRIGFSSNFIDEGRVIFVGKIGSCGSINEYNGKFWATNNTYYVKQPSTKYIEHARCLLRSIDWVPFIGGSSNPYMPLKNFDHLQCLMAADAIHEAFETIVGALRSFIEHCEQENASLAATRDFLLPKLMSGEVRVKDAEKLVGEAI